MAKKKNYAKPETLETTVTEEVEETKPGFESYKVKLSNCRLLNLRKCATIKCPVLMVIRPDMEITVLGKPNSEWLHVLVEKQYGHVLSKFVEKI